MNETEKYVSAEKLVWSNAPLRLLVQSKISPILLGLIVAVGFNVIAGVAAAFAGCFFTRGTMMGFIQQLSTISATLAGAAIFAFYIWMPRGIAHAVNGIADNQVVGGPIKVEKENEFQEISLKDFSNRMTRSFSRPLWWILPLGLAILAAMVGVYPVYLRYYYLHNTCTVSTVPGLVISIIWMVLNLFAVFGFVFYAFLVVVWFNRLFKRFKVRIQILHPDGAGGLSPLGSLALKLSYPITVVGFVLVGAPITRQYALDRTLRMLFTPDIIGGIILYLAFAPVVFFAPLATAHSSMRKAKNKMLLQISNRFDQEYGRMEEELSGDVSSFDKRYKRMKNFQSLYSDIRKFPVWPFNTENITRFITTTLSPILLAILTNVITRLIP